MKIDGSCHCGNIHYEAEIDPENVAICHCADCQIMSGSPYRAMVRASAKDFSITGEPKIYIKVGESGARRAQAFCAECGTALYATSAENPEIYSIRIGSIHQRHQLGQPSVQIWCDSALPWAIDLQQINSVARQP